MAKRVAFVLNSNGIKEVSIEFKYYSGFAVSQKQKSIASLHAELNKLYDKQILEISSKSFIELGKKLSAFNLKVNLNERMVSLENIFQSSKVFELGGPYEDLLNVSPIEAKKDQRLKTSGQLILFRLNNKDYPIEPKTLFYDWIYCRALNHYQNYVNDLVKYEIFTDIEYNYEKSINCQARSVAIYMLLYKKGVIREALANISSFAKYAYQDYENFSNGNTLFE